MVKLVVLLLPLNLAALWDKIFLVFSAGMKLGKEKSKKHDLFVERKPSFFNSSTKEGLFQSDISYSLWSPS